MHVPSSTPHSIILVSVAQTNTAKTSPTPPSNPSLALQGRTRFHYTHLSGSLQSTPVLHHTTQLASFSIQQSFPVARTHYAAASVFAVFVFGVVHERSLVPSLIHIFIS